jgi:hypothetical protein
MKKRVFAFRNFANAPTSILEILRLDKDKWQTWKTFERKDDFVIPFLVSHGGCQRKMGYECNNSIHIFGKENRIVGLSSITFIKGKSNNYLF